jgi:hypothetical protein
MKNTIANIRLLDVVRLVHGYILYFCLSESFLAKFTKKHIRTVKSFCFFCTNAKVHEMTKMLYKCTNNLFFNEKTPTKNATIWRKAACTIKTI